MPPLLQCYRLCHHVGTKPLFTNIDLTINNGDRIGLVGHNGCGKSTLLSILSGARDPEEGDISRHGDLSLEVVEQFIDPALGTRGLLEALTCKLPEEELVTRQYQAERLLERLGFAAGEFEYRVDDLSGGQQNRLMFARAMINEPNLILFDEPTNHLDLNTLLLFETCLKEMQAAFLIISHDREFLDSVTNRTAFLRDERLYFFDLPYSAAREALADQDAAAVAAREQEEKTIKRLEASASRLATWGRVYDNEKLARKAKSMEKRIEKLKDDKTFVTRGSGLNLSLDVDSTQADRMLALEQCIIRAPDATPLFQIDNLIIRPGERVALLGPNGAGKTTLIDTIMTAFRRGSISDEIRFNPRCQIGFYDQELQQLDPALSLAESLREFCDGSESHFKTQLIRAGFPYLDLDKPVSVLSGGEKARLMFLIIKLNQPNFLILDEPTNHIDIQGKEELEDQILETNATVLITSHDRRFVDNIADRYLLIDNGVLREINAPGEFYRQMSAALASHVSRRSEEPPTSAPAKDPLEQLIELEELLSADLARKPKFQKPRRQEAWRKEIERLNRLLEDTDD
jgi:ATPase subunit of ABC transporter with duplicated ATPase domains